MSDDYVKVTIPMKNNEKFEKNYPTTTKVETLLRDFEAEKNAILHPKYDIDENNKDIPLDPNTTIGDLATKQGLIFTYVPKDKAMNYQKPVAIPQSYEQQISNDAYQTQTIPGSLIPEQQYVPLEQNYVVNDPNLVDYAPEQVVIPQHPVGPVLDPIPNMGMVRVASQENLLPTLNQGGLVRTNSQPILVRSNSQPQLIQIPPQNILPMAQAAPMRNIVQGNIQPGLQNLGGNGSQIIPQQPQQPQLLMAQPGPNGTVKYVPVNQQINEIPPQMPKFLLAQPGPNGQMQYIPVNNEQAQGLIPGLQGNAGMQQNIQIVPPPQIIPQNLGPMQQPNIIQHGMLPQQLPPQLGQIQQQIPIGMGQQLMHIQQQMPPQLQQQLPPHLQQQLPPQLPPQLRPQIQTQIIQQQGPFLRPSYIDQTVIQVPQQQQYIPNQNFIQQPQQIIQQRPSYSLENPQYVQVPQQQFIQQQQIPQQSYVIAPPEQVHQQQNQVIYEQKQQYQEQPRQQKGISKP